MYSACTPYSNWNSHPRSGGKLPNSALDYRMYMNLAAQCDDMDRYLLVNPRNLDIHFRGQCKPSKSHPCRRMPDMVVACAHLPVGLEGEEEVTGWWWLWMAQSGVHFPNKENWALYIRGPMSSPCTPAQCNNCNNGLAMISNALSASLVSLSLSLSPPMCMWPIHRMCYQ